MLRPIVHSTGVSTCFVGPRGAASCSKMRLRVSVPQRADHVSGVRDWGLRLAGAIVAMLPRTPCCIIGLPIGIWAVIVLIDNEVKAAFDRGGPSGGYGGDGGYSPPR